MKILILFCLIISLFCLSVAYHAVVAEDVISSIIFILIANIMFLLAAALKLGDE